MIAGIMAIQDGDTGTGIGVIVLSLPLLIGGRIISNNKSFKKWWKQVEDANLAPQIAQDINTAVAVYNKNPQSRTLKKIQQLNPAAAEQIRNSTTKK